MPTGAKIIKFISAVMIVLLVILLVLYIAGVVSLSDDAAAESGGQETQVQVLGKGLAAGIVSIGLALAVWGFLYSVSNKCASNESILQSFDYPTDPNLLKAKLKDAQKIDLLRAAQDES